MPAPFDYSRALDVALAAAQAAGALLRADFHRPGGPRGHGAHAEADAEAEAGIRDRLEQAFPDHGIRGEELRERDRPARDGDAHVWLLDPNDGTAGYLKGVRGSAVSIALLRRGVPVLGVVYAFVAPDSAGDLLAWAEGCGPIRRNGRELPATRAWAAELTPAVTILVARGADRVSRANAEAVAPARFRAVPSVAYRLALVAAGEGEAGVSLYGPGDWDFAGAHALLRAVGGDLLGADGCPIRYAEDGRSPRIDCFGGSPALLPALVQRDWSPVRARPPAGTAPYGLCWSRKGHAFPDPGRLARAQGCLLGQLAGDALGSLVEFQDPGRIRARYAHGVRTMVDGGTFDTLAGQPTDDSELALLLARTLVARGGFDEEEIARAYAWWYDSHPFDCGHTTRRALASASNAARADGTPVAPAARAASARDSQANGALMRISPLGIFGQAAPPDRLAEWARADATLTHPHPAGRDANAVFTVALAHAISSGASPRDVYDETRDWAKAAGVEPVVLGWLDAAEKAPPADYLTHSGWVAVSFQNAFHRLLHAPDLETGVVETIHCGGDTDTHAAIAGALLGAVHGREAIPFAWRDRLLTCRPISGLPGVRQPRPPAFWPVDALVLAEHLLLAGEGR